MKIYDIIPYLNDLSVDISTKVPKLNELKQELNLSQTNYSSLIKTIERQIETSNNKFTIAFVGMYNCGKSTILNSILELTGDNRLSDKDSPDTAKSTRIKFRDSENDCEALLLFDDGTYEETTWAEAKNFTSQVYLDQNPLQKEKSTKVIEIEYCLNNPILRFCDFLDLPGTGTKNWSTHTKLTHERLKEAELVFWVISTCSEPSGDDLKDLRILKEVKANVVPLINVWQEEEEEIKGAIEPDELKNILNKDFSLYFSKNAQIIKYFAKEIDKAKLSNKLINEEWGHKNFVDFLNDKYLNDATKQHNEKLRKITSVIIDALDKISDKLEIEKELISDKRKDLENLNETIEEQFDERIEIQLELRSKLRQLAEERADTIVEQCVKLSSAFIEDEMRLTNFKTIIDKIKGNKDISRELTEKFKKNYLKLYEQPNWLEFIIKDFLGDANTLVDNRWKRFLRNYKRYSISKYEELEISDDFIDIISSQIMSGLIEKILTCLILFAMIPGGAIIDAGALIIFALINIFTDPLEKYRKNAKLRAKVMISNQRYELKSKIADYGLDINKVFDEEFEKILISKREKESNQKETLKKIMKIISEFEDSIIIAQDDMNSMNKGI